MFREVLAREFEARRARNPRYSLRAFAAFLKADHSTVSQVMRGRRPAPVRAIRDWARRLGLCAEEAALIAAASHHELRPWTAEGWAIVSGRAHWEILRLVHSESFRADTRWIAGEARLTVDQVNEALSRLLRLGLLEMGEGGRWRDPTGAGSLSEAAFRGVALARVRERTGEQPRG